MNIYIDVTNFHSTRSININQYQNWKLLALFGPIWIESFLSEFPKTTSLDIPKAEKQKINLNALPTSRRSPIWAKEWAEGRRWQLREKRNKAVKGKVLYLKKADTLMFLLDNWRFPLTRHLIIFNYFFIFLSNQNPFDQVS